MKKIESVQEFVEKLDAAKKVNPKDLSSDQDLTIGITQVFPPSTARQVAGSRGSSSRVPALPI